MLRRVGTGDQVVKWWAIVKKINVHTHTHQIKFIQFFNKYIYISFYIWKKRMRIFSSPTRCFELFGVFHLSFVRFLDPMQVNFIVWICKCGYVMFGRRGGDAVKATRYNRLMFYYGCCYGYRFVRKKKVYKFI